MNEALKQNIIDEYRAKFASKTFVPGQTMVPVSGKVFDENEILLGVEAVLDGWWTEGRFTTMFEHRLAKWLGVKFCSVVNSGSSANLVALAALTSTKVGEKRLKPGDEVIAVAAAFPSTVNPIIQLGLVPVFVDIELGTYNIDIRELKKAISPKTRAIMVAHTLGNPFDLEEIAEFCKANDWWLIEDNCDALGASFNGKLTGTFGQVATCSFYPAHHITMGEGGAVFTNSPKIFRAIESVRDWGRDCWCAPGKDNTCQKRYGWELGKLPFGYDHKYTYSEIGYNLKATDMQAAIGLAQLEKLPGFIAKRRENFDYLYERFKEFEDYFILPAWHPKASPSWFGFLLSVRPGAPFSRDELIKFLNEKKIGTRYLFSGNLLRQPYFTERQFNYRVIGSLPNSDLVMNNTFWVGVYPGLTREMLDYVVACFKQFIASKI